MRCVCVYTVRCLYVCVCVTKDSVLAGISKEAKLILVCENNCEAIVLQPLLHQLNSGGRLPTHSWQFMIILTHQV